MTISLVLVSDSAVCTIGFNALFSDDPDVHPISVVASPDDFMELLKSTIPDVAIVDYDTDGAIGLTEVMSVRWPLIAVLVVSTLLTDELVRAALDAGVGGFVSKRNEPEYFRKAVKSVADGQSVLDPRVTRSVIAWATGDRAGAEANGRLSGQELQVLRLVARGESNKRIARRLGLSENTVKTYLRRTFRKINCGTRSEAAARLTRHGAF